LEADPVIALDSLPAYISGSADSPKSFEPQLPQDGLNLPEMLEGIERTLLVRALERTGGRKKDAAELLSLSFRSFRYRLKKLGIEDSA